LFLSARDHQTTEAAAFYPINGARGSFRLSFLRVREKMIRKAALSSNDDRRDCGKLYRDNPALELREKR
jgi:hypothetical protein